MCSSRDEATGSGSIHSYPSILAILISMQFSAPPNIKLQGVYFSFDKYSEKWNIQAQYHTISAQRLFMDAVDIVNDIYKLAEAFIKESDLYQEVDFIGKPEYLWGSIKGPKTTSVYSCLIAVSCNFNAGVRFTETKTQMVHDFACKHNKQSHILHKMHARS
jgi:hypothetical protein